MPVPAHMTANQNGKRPAADIPLEAKKPAVGDGAKYRKSYWLAELDKVKEKWGPGWAQARVQERVRRVWRIGTR